MDKMMSDEIQNIQTMQQGEIILYQPDETVRLEVRLENETVWLTQQQMAEFFGRDRFLLIDNEVYHIRTTLKDLGKKWFAFTLRCTI